MKVKLTIVMALLFSGTFGCWSHSDVTGTENEDGGTDEDTEFETDTETDFEIDPNLMISNVTVEVHDKVQTMLVVRWSQDAAVDDVHLRFTFENNEWYRSIRKSGTVGEHEEVVVGVPENTSVTIHIFNRTGEDEAGSKAYYGTTGYVPSSMPRPVVESYDASIATEHRWMLGAVSASSYSYEGPFWLYIIDRAGRILWYYSNLGDNPITVFPRVSRDNKYIFFPNRKPWFENHHYSPRVIKMTLDWKYYEEIILDLSDNADMTDDGHILFNTTGEWYYFDSWLKEWSPDGTIRNIWDCNSEMGGDFHCYSNTVNWNPIDDTVLVSFPIPNTVVEIDRLTGEMVGVYGDHFLSYSFNPSSWEFEYQHYANITPSGTLMVSSHMPNSGSQHAFLEFEIDRTSETLTEKWVFNDGNEWAESMGEAHPIPDGNGNIMANYGTDGVIKEITQDKNVAWQLRFGTTGARMVGHCSLIDDLYTLCEGF